MKAVILAGGEGTRLRPLTLSIPKPVVPVVDRPFLRHQLDLLATAGVHEVVFSVAYQPEKVEAAFGDGSRFGLRIRYAVEATPLGTGGAVKNAEPHLDETTVIFNGDVLCDVDLPGVVRTHRESGAACTIVLYPVPNPAAYGLVEFDQSGRIQRFLEKPDPAEITTDTINAGIYVIETRTLELMPAGINHSIERGFFPALIARGDRVQAYVHRGYWIDIGTPEKYLQVHRDILRGRFPVRLEAEARGGGFVHPEADLSPQARLLAPFYVGPGCHVEAGATLGPDAVLVEVVTLRAGAEVRDSVLWRGCEVDGGARIAGALLGTDVRVGRSAYLGPGCVLGESALIPDYSRTQPPPPPPRAIAIEAGIFKAYDIRGIYPGQLDGEIARRVGCALVDYLGARRIAVGRDVRLSSPELAAAFIRGARSRGCEVLDIGVAGTDMLYYFTASRGLEGGAIVTASHNPKQWNGIKMVRRGALALSGDPGGGIREIQAWVLAGKYADDPGDVGPPAVPQSIRDDYGRHCLSFIDASRVPRLKVVLDPGNGMGAVGAEAIFRHLPLELVKTCFELDGTFPNHPPDPLEEANRRQIVARVVAEKADLGIAWDGDADRCFFIDDTGRFVSGDFITAILGEGFCRKEPGARIVYDVRASRAVKDRIEAAGGRALMHRVGHAFIKRRMRDENAVFGGEVSGHYYFRDNWFADNGMIPALLVLELLGREQRPLSELLAPLRARYHISGEINSKVDDVAAAVARIEERYRDGVITRLDGISVDYADWHFNVRPSNTEPLLRLNLEAGSAAEMEQRRDEILAVIRA